MAYTAIPPVTSGGGGGGTSSAPISGDGSGGNPFTIANGAITPAKIAAQANQTVLGNGSGASASPAALDIAAAASGLVATATTLKNTLTNGVAGGQTVIGDTAASGNLTLTSTANATKGKVYFNAALSAYFDEGIGNKHVINTASNTVPGYATNATGNSGLASGAGAQTSLINLGSAALHCTSTVVNVQGGRLGGPVGSVAAAVGPDAAGTTTLLTAPAVPGISITAAAFRVYGGASNVLNQAALATTATDGFLYIPTCAGPPTGVPTAQTGTVALVYDTTNNKLYIYNGAWKGGTAPGTWT